MELASDATMTRSTTGGVYAGWPPPAPVRSPTVDGSWTAWTLATVTAIWICVVLISVLSPDMIHGSAHQRMPVAAFGTWFWGFGASVAALMAMARLRGDVARQPLWMMLSGATTAIWIAAALVSIFGPTLVTGSDPTTIPVAALIAPVVATLATTVTATVVVVVHGLTGPRQHR